MWRISNVIPLIKQAFFAPTVLEPKLQLLFLLFQQIIYITLINGTNFQETLICSQHSDIFVMLALVLSCTLKFFMRIRLTPAFGLVILQVVLKSGGILKFISINLLGILFIADLLDSISLDISSSNVQSQIHNTNKISHFLLLKGSVIITSLTQVNTYSQLLFFGGFILLLWRKDKALVKRQEYANMCARFYMWAAFEHLRLFLGSFVQTDTTIMLMASLVTSQLLYQLYEHLSRELNFQQMLAKQEYFRLSFLILKYHFYRAYDEKTQKMINQIKNDHQIQSHLQEGQDLYQIVIKILSKGINFQSLILMAELNIANNHLVKAIILLSKAKQQVKWYNFIDQIILCKTQYALLEKYQQNSSRTTFFYEQQWSSYLQFQQLLYKSARQNLKLNNYLRSHIIELKMVRKIGFKINRYQRQIQSLYEKINKQFIRSTQSYFNYLMKVKKNCQTAQKIVSAYLFNQKTLVDFQVNSKIYLKLKIDEEGMKIGRVGFNSMQLLHYSRKQLECQPIERMIPNFFRTQHQRISSQLIRTCFQKAFFFQKMTFILDNNKKYQKCNLFLKMNYRLDEEFVYQGHMQIIQDQKWNFRHFLFVNDNGKILEAGQDILKGSQLINHNVNQFFVSEAIGKPITRILDLNKITYYPVITMKNGPEVVYFYVRRQQSRKNRSKVGIRSKLLQQSPQCHQQKMNSRCGSSQSQQLQAQMKNVKITSLFVLLFVFIFAMFACQYLIFFSSKVKYNNQYLVVVNGEDLMQYYDKLFILAIDLTYLDLNIHFRYQNAFTDVDSVSPSLGLSHFNEQLKHYNRGKYTIPSTVNQITYQQSNYEMVQQLISNAIAYQKFKDDYFSTQNLLHNFQNYIFTLLVNGFTDYRISLFIRVGNFVQIDNYYNRIAFVSSLVVIIVIFLLFVKLFTKLRSTERLALTYPCSAVNPSQTKEILQFMHGINSQEVVLDRKGDVSDYTVIAQLENYNSLTKTEISFLRQTSNRDLMQDTLTRSNIQFNEAQMNQNRIPQKDMRIQFEETKSYYFLLIIGVLLVLVIISLVVGNQLINNRQRDINESVSINSIIVLYRASAFYSRAVIITLNSILLKQVRSIDNSVKYNQQINNFYTYLSQFNIPTFPQTAFAEFSEYAEGYNQLYQLPICQYLQCGPQYEKEMDLYFMTVINKFSANLSNLANVTSVMNSSQFKDFISQPEVNKYINGLFMSEYLLRNYTIGLSMTYLKNYEVYMNNLFDSKMKFVYAIVAFTVVGLILLIYMYMFIKGQQESLIKLIKIFY